MITEDGNLKYTLAKSERKTLSIYVVGDGSVFVRAPRSIQEKELDAIIKLKSYWIYKSIAETHELNRTRVARRIANGEGFLYMGKSYRLRLEKDQEMPLTLNQGYFMLQENEVDRAR
jgi:predicted metal-dependent hydrolase